MNERRGNGLSLWRYESRALTSTLRRKCIVTALSLLYIGAGVGLLLVDVDMWAIWTIALIAIVTWLVLGRFWLNRDLKNAGIEDELRAILDKT